MVEWHPGLLLFSSHYAFFQIIVIWYSKLNLKELLTRNKICLGWLSTKENVFTNKLSHRQDYVSFSQTSAGSLASKGYMKLKPGSTPASPILSQFTHRYTSAPITAESGYSWRSYVCHPFLRSLRCFANAVKLTCIGMRLNVCFVFDL